MEKEAKTFFHGATGGIIKVLTDADVSPTGKQTRLRTE